MLHKQATQTRDCKNLLTAEEHPCQPLYVIERPALMGADGWWVLGITVGIVPESWGLKENVWYGTG